MADRTTQRARVADTLLKEIREGRYPVGARLPSERQLADTYGVSRPVVREALGMLVTLDVVQTHVGRGAFVTNADVTIEHSTGEHGLIDVVDAREVIESGALRLAAKRARRAERNTVERALRTIEEAMKDDEETADADLALHRSITEAARSPILVKLWTNMTNEIAHTIRISPHGRTMSDEIFEDHRLLARGVTHREVEPALEACARLYEEHRTFLRSLLS